MPGSNKLDTCRDDDVSELTAVETIRDKDVLLELKLGVSNIDVERGRAFAEVEGSDDMYVSPFI